MKRLKPCRQASRVGAAPFRWRLIVMAKEPVMGRVKTRLARDIGHTHALRFYRANIAAVLGRLAHDPRFMLCLAVAPDAAVATRALPCGLTRYQQGGGDLGSRMQRQFDTGHRGPTILVGTDIPGIRSDLIVRAFRLLGRHDAVFGPADDGGYWLVGLKRIPRVPRPFFNVRWSSAETLADTLANFDNARVATIGMLADVDDAAELSRQSAVIGRRILPAS